MVGPLYARAKYSRLYPDLFQDDEASNLIERVMNIHSDSIDEFKILDEFIDEFLGLSFIVRAKTFDDTIKQFIEKKSQATIVNLGCGLDTTFSRVDNGSILWYDLDLPDAIEYRRRLIPETERSKCIPKSIFDQSWMDDIVFTESTNGHGSTRNIYSKRPYLLWLFTMIRTCSVPIHKRINSPQSRKVRRGY